MIGVGVLCNNEATLRRVLGASDLLGLYKCVLQGHDSASSGFNHICELLKVELLILAHQDIFFPDGWFTELPAKLNDLPSNWKIAGCFGMNLKGEYCGRIWDRRVPRIMETKHTFPQEALNIDGCMLIIRNPQDFRFDENLVGFDLYDTYAVLRAREMGGSAWIIDHPVEHYATRPWDWKPDEKFMQNWKYLKQRFPNEKVISTCFQD